MRARERLGAVIYDLDGTLIDSARDIVANVNAALVKRQLPELPFDQANRMIGTGAHGICKQSLEALAVKYDEESLQGMISDFFASYSANPVVHTAPYPGVVEGLRAIAGRGVVQGICTNKSSGVTGLVLDRLGLSDFFGAVVAADQTPAPKPAAGHLLQVVDALGLADRPEQVAYVGDTPVDLQSARNAGIRFFAVSWGRQQILEDSYSTVIDDLAKIADHYA